MSTYLVTGVAGFIASKVAEFLLAEGHTVVGVDNLNDYYDVRLKYYRLARLAELSGCEASQVARIKEAVEKPESGNLKPEGSGFDTSPVSNIQVSGLFASVSHGENRGQTPGGQQASTAKSQVSLKSDRFEFHTLDIEDLPALERVFARSNFTAVFNLAARAGVRYSMENPHVYLSTNTLGTLNILECQRKYGVKKQVLASTSSLYAGCPMPFTEDQPVNTPLSPYAATKKAAEMLAYTYHKLYGLDVTVVRYFTVFGPAGRPDMAPFRFIKWIDEGTPITLFGDGTQSRDFTYVDDIARGTVLAGRLFGGQLKPETGNLKPENSDQESGRRLGAEGGAKLKAEVSGTKSGTGPESSGFRSQVSGFRDVAPSYDVINLGGGRNPVSLHTIIGWIEKFLTDARSSGNPQVSGLRSQVSLSPVRAKIAGHPFHAADMKETWADITKAERLLGWKPEVSPEEGFRKAVEWYAHNQDWLGKIIV